MNSRIVSSLAVALFLSFFSNLSQAKIEVVLGEVRIDDNRNLPGYIPQSNLDEIVLSREQFVLSYNKEKRSPNWVAWTVERASLGNSGRSNNFSQDFEIENYLNQTHLGFHAVVETEYKGSCFDRGHQVPSADRTDSLPNNEKTFLMSNMVPQTPYLNRVIWEHLESYTRDLVKNQNKKVFIVAGPVYNQDFGSIGPNKDIQVPNANFKIIYILDANQDAKDISEKTNKIVVLMPNVLQDGTPQQTNKPDRCGSMNLAIASDPNDWKKYLSDIQTIEKLSGLTFKFAHP